MPTLDEVVVAALAAAERNDLAELDRLCAVADQLHAEHLGRLTAAGALASSALWYATRGVPVFPVRPRDKVPLVRWRDEATTDQGTVAAWWRSWPHANIGMPTGLRWDVIDIDGPAGYTSRASLRDRQKLPDVLGCSTTPRHGMHLFITPTGDGNAAGFLPGLDYRGLGGYVVLPPSIGANGELYLWDTCPVTA